jgi:hypothetical protein
MGNVVFQMPPCNWAITATNPATRAQDNDTNSQKDVWQFPDAVTTVIHSCIPIPRNYLSGGLNFKFRFRCSTNTGNAFMQLLVCTNIDGSIFGSTTGTTVNMVTAVAGTAGNTFEATVSALTSTGANSVAADRFLFISMQRLGGNVSDTCSGLVEYLGGEMFYSADPAYNELYYWVPAQAMTIPSGSTAARGFFGNDSGGLNLPQNMFLSDTAALGSYADFRVTVPPNFGSFSGVQVYTRNEFGGAGTIKLQFNGGRTNAGAGRDPALTSAIWANTISPSASNLQFKQIFGLFSGPPSLGGGDDLMLRFLRDSSDTSTVGVPVWGTLLIFGVSSSGASDIRFDPVSAVSVAGNAATYLTRQDANSAKFIARMPDSGADVISDWEGLIPTNYASGGTLILRMSSASTGDVRLSVKVATPALGTNADPALTTVSTFTVSLTANNLIEFALDISSGIVADDTQILRVTRISGDGADTLTDNMDLEDVILRALPS